MATPPSPLDRSSWSVILGPHATCEDCDFGLTGDYEDHKLSQAVRNHVRMTGHRVQIQRGQMCTVAPAKSRERS